MTELEVLRAGPLTTVQDTGRPGFAHLGVPPSGAADLRALELGNRIAGNPRGAAALEATLAGPRVRFRGPAAFALTGAEAAARLNGRAAAPRMLLHARDGDVLELGGCTRGVRAYVCVRGGIDVEPVLGSRSTDLLSGLGPPPLRDGDVLRVGPRPATQPEDGLAPAPYEDVPVLHVIPGPREDSFVQDALTTLTGAIWQVLPASNRVGIRLDGPRLARADADEILSEGLVTGSLQVPPSGLPILLLPDHPTTGGYPVLAVVCEDHLPLAGQLAPGATLRFALAAG